LYLEFCPLTSFKDLEKCEATSLVKMLLLWINCSVSIYLNIYCTETNKCELKDNSNHVIWITINPVYNLRWELNMKDKFLWMKGDFLVISSLPWLFDLIILDTFYRKKLIYRPSWLTFSSVKKNVNQSTNLSVVKTLKPPPKMEKHACQKL